MNSRVRRENSLVCLIFWATFCCGLLVHPLYAGESQVNIVMDDSNTKVPVESYATEEIKTGIGSSGETGFETTFKLAQKQTFQRMGLSKGTVASFFSKQPIKEEETPKGKVVHLPEGILSRVKSFGEDQTLQGIKFTKNDWVVFYTGGQIAEASLSRAQDIQGISAGKCHKYVPFDPDVHFFSNGKLKKLCLAKNATIQGIELQGGGDSHIQFHKNGKLEYCIPLAKDQTIQNLALEAGSFVRFYENGQPDAVALSKDQEIQKIIFTKGDRATFYENGSLSTAFFKAGQRTIQGYRIGPTNVSFYENGRIKSIDSTSSKGKAVTNLKCVKSSSDSVRFDESGKIIFCGTQDGEAD